MKDDTKLSMNGNEKIHWKFNFKDILQTTGIISCFQFRKKKNVKTVYCIGTYRMEEGKKNNEEINNEGGEKTVNKHSVRIIYKCKSIEWRRFTPFVLDF